MGTEINSCKRNTKIFKFFRSIRRSGKYEFYSQRSKMNQNDRCLSRDSLYIFPFVALLWFSMQWSVMLKYNWGLFSSKNFIYLTMIKILLTNKCQNQPISALPRVKRVELDWLTQFLADLRNEYGTQCTPFFTKFWFGSNSKVDGLAKIW